MRPLSIETDESMTGGAHPSGLGVGSKKFISWTLDELAIEIKVKPASVKAVSKSLDEDGDPVLVADFGSMSEDGALSLSTTLMLESGAMLNELQQGAFMRLYRSAKLFVTQSGLGESQPVLPTTAGDENQPPHEEDV